MVRQAQGMERSGRVLPTERQGPQACDPHPQADAQKTTPRRIRGSVPNGSLGQAIATSKGGDESRSLVIVQSGRGRRLVLESAQNDRRLGFCAE